MARLAVAALRLVSYMKEPVAGARGGVVSISLKKASRAVGAETRAEAAAVKAVLDSLASLGLLEALRVKKKPRCLLRRESPLWTALEAGHVELVAAIAERCAKPPRRRRRRGPGRGMAALRSFEEVVEAGARGVRRARYGEPAKRVVARATAA